MANDHVERPYWDDIAKDDSEYWGAIAPYSPSGHLGLITRAPANGDLSTWPTVSNSAQGFHQIYQNMGTMMALYRGDEAYRPLAAMFLVGLCDMSDDQRRPNGDGFFTNIYFAENFENGVLYATQQQMIERQSLLVKGKSPPFATDKFWMTNGTDDFKYASLDANGNLQPAAYGSHYLVQQCAMLGLADWLGFPNCKRVRLQLVNRGVAYGTGPTTKDRYQQASLAYPYQMVMQWSVLPTGI